MEPSDPSVTVPVKSGGFFEHLIEILDANGAVLPFEAGATATSALVSEPGGAEVTAMGVDISALPAGQLTLSLTGVQSAALTIGETYHYDAKIVRADGQPVYTSTYSIGIEKHCTP